MNIHYNNNKEIMMEKNGAIDPKVTPPENGTLDEKCAEVQKSLLKELEEDSAKRLAEHASNCCGGQCKSDKAVVDN